MEQQTKNNDPSPRYEFRVFAKNLQSQALLLQRLTTPVPDEYKKRESEEIYLITSGNHNLNIKIRGNKLDIKRLIYETEGLEQWEPVMKCELQVSADQLKEEVFPALQVEMSDIKNAILSLDEFLALIKNQTDVRVVKVEKERFGYMVNDTICEFARVSIAGIRVETVSTESTKVDDVKKTIRALRLEGFENTNYIKAIKWFTGDQNAKSGQ